MMSIEAATILTLTEGYPMIEIRTPREVLSDE